ncbi:hypothetical protein Droror1_Dr00022180 [Drosera rotundifolia]
MAQHQPRRDQHTEPIKYGDVFPVSGRLSGEPITPQDAVAMQSAENQVLGMTPKGGLAAVMQSAATWNVQAGAVDADEGSDVVAKEGVWVRTAEVDGTRVVTEGVGREK